MRRIASVFSALCALGVQLSSAENLLANPGFETLDADGTPRGWDVFVQPGNDSIGRVSTDAATGQYSVSLFNPAAYASDPANNWSQVVYGDFGGKLLRASILARTESEAGSVDTSLWVQCFQKTPSRVLATGTSDSAPASPAGTEWSELDAEVEVPAGTAFVVVRCVLRGAGRVWFDDATLSIDSVDEVESSVEDAAPTGGDASFEKIREQLQAAIDVLQRSNDALQTHIRGLEDEIGKLREQLGAIKPAAVELNDKNETTDNVDDTDRTERGHILVPRDSGAAP